MKKILYIGEDWGWIKHNNIYELEYENSNFYFIKFNDSDKIANILKGDGILLDKWREQRINKILEED